jgi:pyrimidine operon attenuation protein/uracil phosphoribosyltransferase
VGATPTPRRFYVHDDLTDDVRERHGAGSPADELAHALMALVRRDTTRVTVLTLQEQIEALVARGPRAPVGLAVGISRAGERVARQLHARTGWFPTIGRVDLTREEDGRGGYAVVSPTGVPLARQLAGVGVEAATSLAVVDDTIFSGITLRQVLEALSPALRARTHAFCLRCVEESLAPLRALCPVAAGFAAPGHILDEISFINASGLVRRGSIRRTGLAPLAFFERPEWMHAWFPGHGDEVVDVCRRLNRLLEPTGAPSLPAAV